MADFVAKVFWGRSARESAERDSYEAPFADNGFRAATSPQNVILSVVLPIR